MVNKRDVFGFELFDSIFKDIENAEMCISSEIRNMYSSSYPPVDVIMKKNKDLLFKFAVAGYERENVNVSFEGDKLILELKNSKEKEIGKLNDGEKYIQKGLRTSASKTWYFVPVSKYDTDNVSAILKDGILTVEVPAKEIIKPKTVEIKNL